MKEASRTRLPVQNVRLRYFKAVRDSGLVRFTPLTVFIGNNGSGKSSMIEGLEVFRNIVVQGTDEAFLPWRGFEHIWNKAVPHGLKEDKVGRLAPTNTMGFEISGAHGKVVLEADLTVSTDNEGNRIQTEPTDTSRGWRPWVEDWQFLNLDPRAMLDPTPEQRALKTVRLAKDGANIAQYLQSILDIDPHVLESIVETVKSVLPYVRDLRPAITQELQRLVYLRLNEEGIEDPLFGWLLSQGTLRIVALLAVLRHPQPPSVVFIEELENGLDPRSIQLVVEEIRSFLADGRQVVATTHSPYLLDLLDLSHIVVVERSRTGAPTFTRPSRRQLKGWAEKFSPGRLYTMGNLTER